MGQEIKLNKSTFNKNIYQKTIDTSFSQLIFNVEQDLISNGFNQGVYKPYYNILYKVLGNPTEKLYISEISSDRTEIRLSSNVISSEIIISDTNTFIQNRESNPNFVDFNLNFGDNVLLIANNIKLDLENQSNPSVLIKLYSPLPPEYDLKNELWLVYRLQNPLQYQVEFEDEIIEFDDNIKLQGPNFNLDVKDTINNSTPQYNYLDLLNSTTEQSNNQLNNILSNKGITLNIDYSDYDNFIHFSSAKTRLENFYYKVTLLEGYSGSINTIQTQITSPTTNSINSIKLFEDKIQDIIQGFDGYESYLYFKSESFSWPKQTSTPPYQLYPSNSPEVISWLGSSDENSPSYGGVLASSSLFDNNNPDNLLRSIPEYLRLDTENQKYELFVNMLAQHYDDIWVSIKDVSNKFNNDNRLEFGISKDLVADAIREFGLKIYQNNFSNKDLYTAFLGFTKDGTLFPYPDITGSLPTPTGFEYSSTLISASNDVIPLDNVNKSIYKRIYHNIPFLLKSKGTLKGLRSLITSYGIPDTILNIKEFGGKDNIDVNKWDYWKNEYNYKFTPESGNKVNIPFNVNSLWNSPNDRPSTVELRFKTDLQNQTNIPQYQCIFKTDNDVSLVLRYEGTGFTSGSYSGATIDPQYQYAYLDFYPSSTSTPISIELPFYNEDWWSVMINNDRNVFTLYVGNKIYEGGDNGTQLGFYQTGSISDISPNWYTANTLSLPEQINIGGNLYTPLTGSLQEVRYYNTSITEKSFKDYIKNPYSFEGSTLNSSPNELIFRAPLGNDLYTGSTSIHPKVTGSWDITQSFSTGSEFTFDSTPTFTSNVEYIFIDQPNIGIKTHISDKIRLEDNNIPEGDTLSPLIRLNQEPPTPKYTQDINYIEVSFSPQNEINDDINGQLGYFNIGELIGDPMFRTNDQTSYPELDKLRNEYFKKYIKNYNYTDFVRLIKFFDNSLFKMIKDFTPARTSLASGITIKQHILERNRYPHQDFTFSHEEYSGSLHIGNIKGSTGGSFEKFNGEFTTPYGPLGNGPENIFNITQSWLEYYPTVSGSTTTPQNTQDEFYNGEFSGSQLTVTQQNINPGCDVFKRPINKGYPTYGVRVYSDETSLIHSLLGYYTLDSWLSPNNSPTEGYISIWVDDDPPISIPQQNPVA